MTKEQRQTGKVGELSCGYGAGGGAVKDFAAKMGVEMVEAEANKLVIDWRDSEPEDRGVLGGARRRCCTTWSGAGAQTARAARSRS